MAMWSYIQEQKFLLLQYFGICYSFVVITALYLINVSFTCPALYGWSGCTTPILIGSVIVANTVLNLVLFRLCSKRNRADVHYKGLKGPSSVASPLQLPVNNNNNNPTAVGLNFRPPSMPAMANSEGNYTKSQVVSLSLTSGPTKFCYTCQANFPSRVHHCSLCDYCVVRRVSDIYAFVDVLQRDI